MTLAKKCFIKELHDNQQLEELFLLKSVQLAETKAGKPYLTLVLLDKSGEISGRVWEQAEKFLPECQAGQVVAVEGQVQAYKGVLQLKVGTVRLLVEGAVDLGDFLPCTSGDIPAMAAELKGLSKTVADPDLNKLLQAFIKDEEFFAAFCKAPAAKAMHHAYLGGLLEHTLSLTRLAAAVAKLYPQLDRSLLLAGAILHDVGKVTEFTFTVLPFDYSDEGRLVGHLVMGVEMIQARVAKLRDFPAPLAMRLKHLLLSHHGRYEYGSPSLPMLREAFVLNFIDDLDAKMNYFDRLGAQVRGSGYQWSEYQRNLERFLYLAMPPPPEVAAAAKPAASPGGESRQSSLW